MKGIHMNGNYVVPDLVAALFLQWQSYMTSVGGVEPNMPYYAFY